MAFFNYKQYRGKKAADLVIESSRLAIYANASTFMGFPGVKLLTAFSKLDPNASANRVDLNLRDGWREIAPEALKLPASSVDRHGYYTFHSPVFGKTPINGTGPQAKILGKYTDTGKLVNVSVAFAGTNDLLDIADYFHLNNGNVAPHTNPLLTAVKQFVIANGLTAQDVIITGYSLGGALTNVVAKYRETLADGFFRDANFLAFASPYIFDKADIIFNLGYENDAVFRILGDAPTVKQAFAALKPGLVNPDQGYESASDNVILFGKAYASLFWSYKMGLSIINRPQGWDAHQKGVRTDAYERIANSAFIDYMDRDSTIIIDQLGRMQRWNTWVRDKLPKSHKQHGRSSFIIGNEHNNMLEGGQGHDYIEGGKGNDRIRTGVGVDRIDGGEGFDTLVLTGRKSDWQFYRLSDGTLFVQDNHKTALTQANSVELIEFRGEVLTWSRPYEIQAHEITDRRFLIKSWNKSIAYKAHTEGSVGDDQLQGHTVFGREGNDTLKARGHASLLHGGEGDDTLIGSIGNDYLFGAEGNDILKGGGGFDQLYGGVGNDLFIFNRQSRGHSRIKDFNHFQGDRDVLLFTQDLFSSVDDVKSAMRQTGKDVTLHKYQVSLTIENTQLADLEQHIGII